VQPPLRDDDSAHDPDDRAPSPRVRLEIDLLASDRHAPLSAPAVGDRREQRTVLVVARDADVRRHVLECLRERTDLRVVEADTIATATRLAAREPPALLILDTADIALLEAIAEVRAVVMVDDVGPEAMRDARIATLARPFSGRDLESLVDRLLSV
jgi:DNA-binding NtrC family response regulator